MTNAVPRLQTPPEALPFCPPKLLNARLNANHFKHIPVTQRRLDAFRRESIAVVHRLLSFRAPFTSNHHLFGEDGNADDRKSLAEGGLLWQRRGLRRSECKLYQPFQTENVVIKIHTCFGHGSGTMCKRPPATYVRFSLVSGSSHAGRCSAASIRNT